MGNVGNLNSDHKTHSSSDRSSPTAMSQKRIERDLSSSPHREDLFTEVDSEESPMIRRAAGKIPHVGIIGAGVAGLRCADVLMQHGVQVTILEGRNRVGGRLCQSDALGHLVDLGPNWIHGTDDNPILDLAQKTNTLAINWNGRQSIFDHLGKQLPNQEAAESSEIVWGIIEQAMTLSNDESTNIPPEKSLFDFFNEKAKNLFPSTAENESDDDMKVKREKILQMSEMWGAFIGSPIQKQSLKFFWLEECIDGENLFVAGTYQKVLNKIAEPALKAGVKFGRKVVKIISSQEDSDPSVTTEIDGHDSLTFDEVVMTAPLGWLKRNTDAFEPELPNRLQEAIASIGYGNLDKVYINFPTAFWNDTASSTSSPAPLQAAAPDASIPNDTATTAPLHQGPPMTSPIDSTQHPGFMHWTIPSYAPETNPEQWTQEAMNLAALPESTAHSTLLFYTFGPTSIHLAKLLESNPSSSHQELLATFFRPYFSLLPNYLPSNPNHQPKSILATAWTNDELAGFGSYSNFQIGLERADQDIEVMRRGLPERGVWLAGEHTAPFVALGTVTGAYWSGEGVAKRIARAYGLKSQELETKEV